MSLVDIRYAEALVGTAVEKDALDLYQTELTSLSDIYSSEAGLQSFLLSPQNSADTKKNVITAAFGGKIQKELLNLLYLLVDRNRIDNLPGICTEYIRKADERRNILNITITVAVSVDQTQIDKIGEKFRKMYHASSVKAGVIVDPELIGGVRVAVGDKLYDGSISGKLGRLKALLK